MAQLKKRSQLKLLLRKVDKISELLNQIKEGLLQEMGPSPGKSGKGLSKKASPLPSTGQLQNEYEQLLSRFASQGSQVVQEFVSEHTTRYLGEFIHANSLPISTKTSKKAIEDILRSQLASSLTIRGNSKDKASQISGGNRRS